MIVNNCLTCGISFTKPHNPSRAYKFCSIKCSASNYDKRVLHARMMMGRPAWNKGEKGRKKWHNTSGFRPGWNKGVPNPNFSGDKNPNWAGGVTPENAKIRKSIKYKEWRASVFKRDGYKCVLCGEGGWGNIQADHIKPFATYPLLRFDLNNGRTLCAPCHRATATWGRRAEYRQAVV